MRDAPSRTPGPLGAWRRWRLAVLGSGALVVLSTPFAAPPLADAVTGEAPAFADLTRPLSYLIGAPLFGVWDTLSLLSLSQHYAVLVTLLALYAAARIRAPSGTGGLLARAGFEGLRGVVALLLLLGFYAAGALVPRPMVGLRLAGDDLVAIDFHSHTEHSHDGWGLFSAGRNRAWHEAGGFDVAYVTDHYTWAGVEDAAPDNPARAGERTVLLSGAEIRIHLRPTNVLGDRARYRFALGPDTIYMEPDSLRAQAARGGPPATLLYTMPGHLQYVVPRTEEEPSGVIGIELSDASPRGLEQVRSQRAEIIALADSVDLALIAAANLHGWGRTVAAWSVMEIPGWREMAPEEIGARIEEKLHAERRRAGLVVERRMPYHHGSTVATVLTAPVVAWEHFRMLGWGERTAWLAWLSALLLPGLPGRLGPNASPAPAAPHRPAGGAGEHAHDG